MNTKKKLSHEFPYSFINDRGRSVVKVLLSAAQFHVRVPDGEVNHLVAGAKEITTVLNTRVSI